MNRYIECDGCGEKFLKDFSKIDFDEQCEISYGDQSDYYCGKCWPLIRDAARKFEDAWTEIGRAKGEAFKEIWKAKGGK